MVIVAVTVEVDGGSVLIGVYLVSVEDNVCVIVVGTAMVDAITTSGCVRVVGLISVLNRFVIDVTVVTTIGFDVCKTVLNEVERESTRDMLIDRMVEKIMLVIA